MNFLILRSEPCGDLYVRDREGRQITSDVATGITLFGPREMASKNPHYHDNYLYRFISASGGGQKSTWTTVYPFMANSSQLAQNSFEHWEMDRNLNHKM